MVFNHVINPFFPKRRIYQLFFVFFLLGYYLIAFQSSHYLLLSSEKVKITNYLIPWYRFETKTTDIIALSIEYKGWAEYSICITLVNGKTIEFSMAISKMQYKKLLTHVESIFLPEVISFK